MGGSPSIPQRGFSNEIGSILNKFKTSELPLFNNEWFDKQPLLKGARDVAVAGLEGVPGIMRRFEPVLENQLMPILNRGGALTDEQSGEVARYTNADLSSRGMVNTTPGAFQLALNRDQYRRARFGEALGQATGLQTALQGFRSGAIQPALATEQAATGSFATLLNPLMNYGSDVYSSNQNAAAAESVAGSNKSSGIAGGALSAVGSIAAAY